MDEIVQALEGIRVLDYDSLKAVNPALLYCSITGFGQDGPYADRPGYDFLIQGMGGLMITAGDPSTLPQRLGNAHPNFVPYQSFETSDGHIILAIGADRQFNNFCRFIGETWHEDERFKTNAVRVKNRGALIPKIQSSLKSYRKDYWIKALNAAGVPCGPKIPSARHAKTRKSFTDKWCVDLNPKTGRKFP